jgi:hypothetical protein
VNSPALRVTGDAPATAATTTGNDGVELDVVKPVQDLAAPFVQVVHGLQPVVLARTVSR